MTDAAPPTDAAPGTTAAPLALVAPADAFVLAVARSHPDWRESEPPLGGREPAADAELLARRLRAPLAATSWSARLLDASAWFTGRLPGAWLMLLAAPLGMATAGLGGGDRFDLLSLPLLGLLSWQLLVLLLLCLPGWRAGAEGPRLMLLRVVRGIGSRLFAATQGSETATAELAERWHRWARPTLLASAAQALHLAAAAFAVGAIAALYRDGLVRAFEATWESTFLGPDAVATLLTILLGPASLLLGLPLPDAEGIARLALEPQTAAPWIHAWALTIVLWVVAPRLLLALLAARRRPQGLDLRDDPVLAGWIAKLRGEARQIHLAPLGYRPAADTSARAARLLAGDAGAAVSFATRDPIPWDAAPDALAEVDGSLAVLVNPAQTAEEEVHGPLLDALCAGAASTCLVVDLAAYDAPPDRRASRADAWRRLAERRQLVVHELAP